MPRLVRRLVIMGGAFRTPGNTTPTTEWNIHVDPEAAGIVFRSFGSDDAPRPLVLGLDVTERLKFTTDHMVRLAHRAGSRPLPELDADELLCFTRASGGGSAVPRWLRAMPVTISSR